MRYKQILAPIMKGKLQNLQVIKHGIIGNQPGGLVILWVWVISVKSPRLIIYAFEDDDL